MEEKVLTVKKLIEILKTVNPDSVVQATEPVLRNYDSYSVHKNVTYYEFKDEDGNELFKPSYNLISIFDDTVRFGET